MKNSIIYKDLLNLCRSHRPKRGKSPIDGDGMFNLCMSSAQSSKTVRILPKLQVRFPRSLTLLREPISSPTAWAVCEPYSKNRRLLNA